SLPVMHIVEPIAPLDAQAAFIGRTVTALDAQDPVILDVIGQLATDAAIRADRIDRGVGGDEPRASRGHQRSGRAGLHAFAAGHARALAHRVAQIELDRRTAAAECVADHVVDLHFAAGSHAARAL